jgi:hypothetical protein
MVKRESTYPYQFNSYYNRLEQQNQAYRILVIEATAKLEKQRGDLAAAKIDLDNAGLPATFKYAALGKDSERLNLEESAIKMNARQIGFKIEDTLIQLLSYVDEMAQDHKEGTLSRINFAGYLKRYKHLLHQGNSLSLACYSGLPINKIDDLIESYNIN